jgi:hypothetical protein
MDLIAVASMAPYQHVKEVCGSFSEIAATEADGA